jgi:SAM-dependent methyltransferase
MDPKENPWDDIFKRDGRVFQDPFPAFGSLVTDFRRHNCERILDVGCGNGRHLVHLARLGFQVTGLDSSWWGLQVAQEWLAEESLNIELVLADMRQPFPFRSESFQGVLATQVIHHALLPTVIRTAVEIDRILMPGGLLFVSVPMPHDPQEGHIEVEPGTFVPTSGTEKGLPHHFFHLEELRNLFPGCDVIDLSTRGEVVNAILAVKT